VPVGHVVCSRAHVGPLAVAGLGPIGVLPAWQGRGIGAALMHGVLAAADALELPLVGLLGAPDLYGRFGFVPAASLCVEAPDPAWGDLFQVRTLAAYERSLAGVFRYAPAFEDL
jgi:putative acetyltransferase